MLLILVFFLDLEVKVGIIWGCWFFFWLDFFLELKDMLCFVRVIVFILCLLLFVLFFGFEFLLKFELFDERDFDKFFEFCVGEFIKLFWIFFFKLFEELLDGGRFRIIFLNLVSFFIGEVLMLKLFKFDLF